MNSIRIKLLVRSTNVVIGDDIVPAAIAVSDEGRIVKILRQQSLHEWDALADEVLDVGGDIVMAGVVDSHVHINEPGRTDWEGFWTATQAAAAGGVTTLVDMPLNSIPPTTTVENFNIKLEAASGKLHVDTAFWGGLVPTNKGDLVHLVQSGVVGFKCFLCPSGVDEFPHVDESDVREALNYLKETDAVLAFHAEVDCGCVATDNHPWEYNTFLESRPAAMETEAVKMVARVCKETRVRCHIVHASAAAVLDIVADAKAEGTPLTAETCYHYLSIDSEHIPNKGTSYKCCPPIRDHNNREDLWQHIVTGTVDLVVSDHSPCPPQLKASGDFLSSWGGISSVQLGLSILWTEAHKRNIPLTTVSRLVSKNPAKLTRLRHKGEIAEGMDADLIVFDPNQSFTVQAQDILHRHKVTPYLGRSLQGRVKRTILRGRTVFTYDKGCSEPQGRILLNLPQ